MNSVNLELMQGLLQVTPLSKTFESASSFESSNSDISFATILNDINQNGIELNDNEANMYEQILTNQEVDLSELHKILSDANVNLNQLIAEDDESSNLIEMLVALNVNLTTKDEVKEVQTAEIVNEEPVEVLPTANAKPVEVEVNEEVLQVEVNPEVEKTETPTIKMDDESLVYEEIAGPIQEAKVPVEPEVVTLEPQKHTYKPNETEKPKKENNELINVDEAISNSDSLLMQVEVSLNVETEKHEDSEIKINTKEVETEIKFEFTHNDEVIISDNSVLKLDLMFKNVFQEATNEEVLVNTNNDNNNLEVEPACETIIDDEHNEMNMEVIDKKETTSDSELAYRQMNSFRVNLDELDNNQIITAQSQVSAKTDFSADFTLVKEAREINLTNQITNSFASRVDLSDEFVIKLKPEGIGEIVVKMVSGSDGSTSVSMITNNQHVKALLESDMADLKTALLNQNVEVKEVVFDNQSSYFSESNFANESNTGHRNQNQQSSNYNQTTSDESETVIAPTDRYYDSSRLHQYA